MGRPCFVSLKSANAVPGRCLFGNIIQGGSISGSPEKQGISQCQGCFWDKNNDHSKGVIIFRRSQVKILLVSPESPDTFWSLKNALKFISKRANIPPLGLLTVAAMLPEAWEKKLVDMAVTKLHDKDIQSADYVFLTGMFVQLESARRVVER